MKKQILKERLPKKQIGKERPPKKRKATDQSAEKRAAERRPAERRAAGPALPLPPLFYRLSGVAINQTPMDWRGNVSRILTALESLKAGEKGEKGERGERQEEAPEREQLSPDLILFPEMSVSGYGCEDAFHSLDLCRRALESTRKIARCASRLLPDSVVVVGLPIHAFDAIYNCSAIILNGRIEALVPKTYLARDGVHYEPRWFRPYGGRGIHYIDLPEGKIPFGRMVFEHKKVRFALEICEDAWVAIRPAHSLLSAGIDILLNPSASHFAFDKHRLRRDIAACSSRSMGTVFMLSNLLGCEAGRMVYDGHLAVASNGRLMGESLPFSYRDFITHTLLLDIESNRVSRLRSPAWRNRPAALQQNGCPTIIQLEKISGAARENGEKQGNGGNGENSEKQGNGESQGNGDLPTASMTAVEPAPTDAGELRALFALFPWQERKEDQFIQSVCLGLFDYLRKSKNRSLVISLSGGADSAACALLAQRMLALSLHELGPDQCLKRLGRPELLAKIREDAQAFQTARGSLLESIPIAHTTSTEQTTSTGHTHHTTSMIGTAYTKQRPERQQLGQQRSADNQNLSKAKIAYRQALGRLTEALAPHFIYTLYQSTKNSSAITRKAARAIAKALNTSHYEINLQKQVDRSVLTIEKILKRPLDPVSDDLSLQNIQARLRAPTLWLLANATSSLLITTSNRSEAAVGYSTMDGDTAGGFAPIAGADKAFIQRWLHFMEQEGDHLLGPVPALRRINEQAPTAELRPDQSDEEELMPYPLLDRIERLAIRDRKSPRDILAILSKELPPERSSPISHADLKKYISRFFQLWSRNQWKRERYAPSFHLDDANLDPRSWYRFPILSGGYREELQELQGLGELQELEE